MPHTERCLVFASGAQQLFGVLTEPPSAASIGVLVIVGGPQYRAGSHRLFVKLARHLAKGGCPVLRFDHCGIGDATGEPVPFDALTPDIGAAADAFQEACPAVKHLVLLGLCDGAAAAMIYLADRGDPRVVGLCLLNPWVRTAASAAATRVRHYYLQRLVSPAFWHKLIAGGVGLGALKGLVRDLIRTQEKVHTRAKSPQTSAASDGLAGAQMLPDFRDRMLRGWRSFGGSSQLILSANDYTAKEFDGVVRSSPEWEAVVRRPSVESLWLPDADHTFSSPGNADALSQQVQRWLEQRLPQALRQSSSH